MREFSPVQKSSRARPKNSNMTFEHAVTRQVSSARAAIYL